MSFTTGPRRGFLFFLTATSALFFTQCKTESTDESTGSSPEAASARAEFITQYCELAAPCCAAVSSGSRQSCENGIGAAVPQASIFDAARATACIDAVRANSKDEHFCSKGLLLSMVPACTVLRTRGNIAIGGSCNDAVTGIECASSPQGPVACVFGAGKQMCQLQELAASEGASCVEDTNDDGTLPSGASLDVAVSEKGTYCDRSQGLHCASQKCVKLIAIGAPCTDSDSCATNAFCDFQTKTCKPLGQNGAACAGDVHCASRYCDVKTKQCSSAGSPVFMKLLCGG